jgi:hypothetical protein
MDWSSILQGATLLTLVVGICSVAVAVYSNQRQTNAAIYLDLSQRLQELYKSIPNDLRMAQLAGQEMAEESIHAVMLMDFLQVIHSSFTLHQAGYLSGALWETLSGDIRHGLKLQPFRLHWPKLRSEFSEHPAFVEYVEAIQQGTLLKGRRRHG